MPIKAEPNAVHNNSNLNNLMSRASSLLNINHANVSATSNNNNNNSNGSINNNRSNKSNHQTTAASAATAAANANANIQLSSQTVANEKFNRIDGGEQQIIVSIASFLFFFALFYFSFYYLIHRTCYSIVAQLYVILPDKRANERKRKRIRRRKNESTSERTFLRRFSFSSRAY